MPEKTRAQLQAELAALKQQVETMSGDKVAVPMPDARQQMIARLDSVWQALLAKPAGYTPQEAEAVVIKTVGVTPETARKYLRQLAALGSTTLQVVDLGHWETTEDVDAEGNKTIKRSRVGETQVVHGETVWQTETRLCATARCPPSGQLRAPGAQDARLELD